MEGTPVFSRKGIQFHLTPTKKFKTVSIALLVRRPLSRDEATGNALIPRILKRGSAKFPDMMSLNRKLESLMGAVADINVVKKGEEQIIQFFIEIPGMGGQSLMDEAVDFLGEICLNPFVEGAGFSEAYTSGEKENLRLQMEARKTDKKKYAALRCIEEMCKGEAFGIHGDGYQEDLDVIEPLGLYQRYKDMLPSSPVELIAIGDFDPDTLARAVEEKIHSDSVSEKKTVPAEYVKNRGKTTEKTERMDVNQAKLCMGFRANISPLGDDYYNLLVANEIFGGGAESKLFVNVREKESLCYYINSTLYRFKSILLVQSGLGERDLDKAKGLVKEQADKVKNGDFTDSEMDKAKKALIKRLRAMEDKPGATMDFTLSQAIAGDSATAAEMAENIGFVTKKRAASAFANLWLDTVYTLAPEKGEGGGTRG